MDKLVGAFSGVLKTSSSPASQPQPQHSDRQYLRLPLESARKLRWFEKAEVQALTKSHFREKRELLDTVAVLKKLLLRHGLDDTKLDAEVAAHLRSAEELLEEHEGVASVLLAALEPHVQELRFENERLQAAIKMGQHAAAASASEYPGGKAAGTSSGPDAAAGTPAMVSKSSSSRLLSACGSLPRRLEPLDLAQLNCSGVRARPRMDPVARQQMTTLEAQCEEYGKQVSELKATLAKQQAARRRGPEGNDASRAQVQSMLMELQEAAREEARKAARADARAMRLEGELKALQAQHRSLSKESGALQQQVAELQQQAEEAAAAAAARVAAALAAGEEAKAAAEAREELASLRLANASLRAELATAQGCVARMEADLQLSRQREASSAAALDEAEALARRGDELAATNMQLMQRLAESRAELETSSYFKKMCAELTAAKGRLDDELLGLASLLSASELRLADMAARVAAADEQLGAAESRARTAESSIALEVERRCGTVLSCRALWPPQLRDEVTSLETRLASLKVAHEAAVRRAEAAVAIETELQDALKTKTIELEILTKESSETTASFASQLQHLREALAESQARAAGLTADLAAERSQSKAREEEALQAAAWNAAHPGVRRHSNGGSNGLGGANSQQKGGGSGATTTTTAMMTPKWQVQNKVGSGSLYNLNQVPSSSGGGGPGAGGRGAQGLTQVDTVYVKNVLFKFLEAHLCNKVQERDVLLPAVATLLQATQEEYAALQKILRATMPPSLQMLSVFGLSR